ncbi:MAG: hypothetical protein KDA91_08090 [Planctomycetaceae bacterium]|nr:hypothetical protein [Planctomycetaceae bacterium]
MNSVFFEGSVDRRKRFQSGQSWCADVVFNPFSVDGGLPLPVFGNAWPLGQHPLPPFAEPEIMNLVV